MKNITEYLREKYGVWGWMGQRAHDASGINSILPLDFIISCDHGTDIPHYFREQDTFSVEKRYKTRKDWSNEDLNESLKGVQGREIFKRWNGYKKGVNLLCYRSVGRLENANGRIKKTPRLYAMPERMKRNFDNKVALYRALPKLSLPRIPGKVVRPGDCTFNSLKKELSLPFVIQFPYGSSGHFTFIVCEEKEYNRIRRKYPTSTVIIRRYINGYSLNVNAVIVSTPSGAKTFCCFPSVQIAGIPECSNFSSAFCGNDYALARDLDKIIIKGVEEHISRIGGWMAEKGYRGIFGMDFIIKDDKVYTVEINPRFQNSTSLHTALWSKTYSREKMLFLVHIAEFLQDKDKTAREYIKTFPFTDLMKPLSGAQIIIHNRMRRNIVTGKMPPGCYRWGKRRLKFIKEGATLDDCESVDDILITCGVPGQFTPIYPNAPICKVQTLKSVMDPANRKKLTQEAKRVVAGVYNKMKLEEVSKLTIT